MSASADSGRDGIVSFLDFELDAGRFELRRGGQPVRVEPRVLEVLLYLIEHRGRVVTKQELIDRVWSGTIVSESALSRCIMEARRAIDDGAREQPLIRTVHSRGYRFEAPVEERRSAEEIAPLAETAPPSGPLPLEPLPPQPPAGQVTRWPKPLWIAAAALFTLVVAGLLVIRERRPQTPPASARITLLPISVTSDDRELQLMAISISDLLEQRLAQTQRLIVRGPDYSRAASLQAASLADIAKETGADNLVSGTLLRSHNTSKAQLTMILHQVSAQGRVRDTPLGNFDVPLLRKSKDIRRYAAIRDRIAQQVADVLLPAFTPSTAGNLSPRNPDAYRLYLLARQRLGDGVCNSAASSELLQRSLELDPEFAPAWEAYGWSQYGMASSCALSGDGYARALEAADHALRLVPAYPSAIGLKATVLVETGRVEEAWSVLAAALEEHPNSPDIHSFSFYVLDYAGYLAEAAAHLEKLQELDPNYLTQRGWTPNPYLYTGDIDRFLDLLPATDSPLFRYYRGLGLFAAGRYAEAGAVLEPAFRINPNDAFARLSQALLAIIEKRPEDARQVLAEFIRQRKAVASSDGEMTYKIAQLLALAGDPQNALLQLRLAADQGFFNFHYLQHDPLIASLRPLPGYRAILDDVRNRHMAFGGRFGLKPDR